VTLVLLRHPDADRHGHALSRAAIRQDLLLPLLRPEAGAEDEACLLDFLPQLLDVGEALVGAPPGEDDGELLSPVAIRPPAPANLPQLRRDHLEHLIAHVVPVPVVDALEVVHVQHGDRVVSAESE